MLPLHRLVNWFVSTYLRSSRAGVLEKKGVLKHFAKFTGKNLCRSLSFNKAAEWGLQLQETMNFKKF